MGEEVALSTPPDEKQGHREETADHLGLCRDCARAPGCTYSRAPRLPVRSCEEFTVGEVVSTESRAMASADERLQSQDRLKKEPTGEAPLGLCRTCVHAATCTFNRPEGGVWHCEEFE